MFSCKIAKANLNFIDEFEEISHNKETFALKNFRLLTSHLKSRAPITENLGNTDNLKAIRPKTTPDAYWNFLNFEERKRTKTPPDLEKTLQRLNIRSFNNILRSNSMKKKANNMVHRASLSLLKPESSKVPRTKKIEFYTLEKIKYNNYKYQKIEESVKKVEKSEKLEKFEKNSRNFIEKENGLTGVCNLGLIDKLKANRIYYFEKNKLQLKKKFEQFYKMSETTKVMKHQIEQSKIVNLKLDSRNTEKKDIVNNQLFPLERVKWEFDFFNELNYLIKTSRIIQNKLNKNEIHEKFADFFRNKAELSGENPNNEENAGLFELFCKNSLKKI